jgi:AcrR family transcriptional regulator
MTDATDGRIRRGTENRRRIQIAFIELLRSGILSPTAELVAEKAGVGLRSVFRHFDDMDGLYREIGEAIEAEIEPMWNVPFRTATWQGRLAEMIDRRAAVFERITPFRIASVLHRHKSQFLDQRQARFAAEQRAILEGVLPASIRKDAIRLEALDLAMSIDAWLRLRREQNLDVAEARATIARLVSALIGETIG